MPMSEDEVNSRVDSKINRLRLFLFLSLVIGLVRNPVTWGAAVWLLVGLATDSVIIGLLVGAATFWVGAILTDDQP